MTASGQAADSPAVIVLVFAAYAEALGVTEVRLPWRAGLTADDIVTTVRRLPGGARIPVTPLVAVNQRYAEPGAPIAVGDEVALIPPVAGG